MKPVQRTNPLKPNEAKKWYPVQYTTKMVDENEVAMLIADETTLNPMEAAMAIRQLRKVVQRLLLDGKSVKLGDWGTFNVTLNTEGAERKEDLTAQRNESRHAEGGLRVAGQNHGERHGFRQRRQRRQRGQRRHDREPLGLSLHAQTIPCLCLAHGQRDFE